MRQSKARCNAASICAVDAREHVARYVTVLTNNPTHLQIPTLRNEPRDAGGGAR